MRNTIDVDVRNDSIDLICNVSGEMAESCINFIVGHAIAVTLARADGTETTETVQSVGGIACYMLDDTCMRCAGEYTVSTEGITPLRFIVESDIPAGRDYSIRYADGAFVVCARADAASSAFLAAYPIGSIYMSVSSTSPADIFGGKWEQIKGRFLLGADDSHAAGTTGGSETETLTIAQMPKHDHVEALHMSGEGFGYMPGEKAHSINKDTLYSFDPAALNTREYDGRAMGTLYAGEGKAHNNMPPYLAVFIWQRVA